MATLAEKRSDAMQIVENPDEYSKKEVMEAKKILKEYDAIQKNQGEVASTTVITVGVLPKSKKQMMKKMKGKETDDKNKTKMRKGGMANGKPHLYLSDGALVVDKLPNAGTKALAKTAKGRQALRNMKLI
jgi:hypothetical protein|tara:strand:+ start:223 stop:612 length:390 start_codon:yes stop_codon:yes gene_type:complete